MLLFVHYHGESQPAIIDATLLDWHNPFFDPQNKGLNRQTKGKLTLAIIEATLFYFIYA
jgi:hypothetical protein